MTRYVLDACALIALLNKEEGANHVAGLYKKAVNREAELIMNKLNLFEVYYGYLKEEGEVIAKKLFSDVENSIININDVVNNELMFEAGKVKSSYKKISLADSFAVAQAIVSDAVLVTSDHHELDIIDNSGNGIIKFFWIR